MKVLLIDDETDLLDLLKIQIESESISVDLAFDGEEGLKKIKETQYDLILSDNHMPKKTGLEILEEITHNNFYIMSGNTDLEGSILKKKGAKGLIHKPFTLDQIQEIIGDSSHE